jgi:hypothetical protein
VPRLSETNSLTAAPGPRSVLVVAKKLEKNTSSEREASVDIDVRRYSNLTGKKGNLYSELGSEANLGGLPYESLNVDNFIKG